ncbi:hypothetical protein GCM10007094_35580 [Pseudovibrio japonicus]|uniref:N-acetyltransferase domain-containing protein n=1 Tax=Pseudovibrio japonicus TaxID=366534 RepID=A0ABQ3ESI5_9HYPH|nr:GNAT family N-acetyltransferase [Pseudovibrio japonicus]GHB43075.1 hypothetical protein GCM10007094_35580 [Pseudovibrio japonicus]
MPSDSKTELDVIAMSEGAVSMETLKISLFEELDKLALREFLVAAWTEAHEADFGEELTKQLVARLDSDDLGGVIPASDGQLYLAKIGENIIGSLACALRGEVVYIWACYLANDYQSKGLGRRVLKHALFAYATDLVACVHVLEGSQDARQFYKKLGFIDCEATKFEVVSGKSTPARIMQARIRNLKLD